MDEHLKDMQGMNNFLDKCHTRLEHYLPEPRMKDSMILTLLGHSSVILRHMLHEHEMGLDFEIDYAILVTAITIANITHGKEMGIPKIVDLTQMEWTSEQKLIHILKSLIEEHKDRLNIKSIVWKKDN